MANQVTLRCNFCNTKFNRAESRVFAGADIRCPKCREYDVELV